MIDPVSVGALGEILGGITAGLVGETLADAYTDGGYDDPYDVGFGVTDVTSDKPAISGKTDNTVISSSESDPLQAVEDYETAGGVIDSTTGGFIYGSGVETVKTSLKENTDGTVEAVAVAGVETNKAIVAIAKVLGVAMDSNIVPPQIKNKMVQALGAAGLLYKGGKKVKAWIDKLGNILFPKSAVDAIDAVLTEEEIGLSDGYTSDLSTQFNQPILTGGTVTVGTSTQPEFVFYPNTAITHSGRRLVTITAGEKSGTVPFCLRNGVEETRNIALLYTHNNKTVYYGIGTHGLTGTIKATNSNVPYVNLVSGTESGKIAWTMVYGGQAGNFPEGTAPTSAETSYTPSTVPTSGGVATSPTTTTPVVIINVPGASSIGDTTDPISASDEDERSGAYPAPLPSPIPDTNVTNPDVPLVDSSVINSTLIDELVEELANTVDPQPPQSSGIIPFPQMPGQENPDTGGVSWPSIVPASGSGLIHVYNPTPAEFVSFGAWLWVTYADATIDKIWNNPFDGIIGAHELYATPAIDGRDNIRSGFSVCPTSADLVRQRYTEIDCGTVIVPEFYGNYLDYSPYSQCYLYLPFIGINEVSIDDIVGHAVNIRYRVDSYTGSTIAMVYVAKQGYRNLCYQFAGNCAVTLPLAGGSQAAIKAGMLQAEAYARAGVQSAQAQAKWNTLGGAVSGAGGSSWAGPLAGFFGALAGAGSAFASGQGSIEAAKLHGQAMQEAARVANKSSVQHSGQFGESHGAMGLKTPFIMIRNPIQVKVVNYNDDYGFPAHKRVIVGGCTGYLRVREVNVISAHATNDEKRAIEEALKAGVYVS